MAVFVLCGLQGQLLAWQEAGALQPFAFEADGAGGDGFAEEIPEGFNGQEAGGHKIVVGGDGVALLLNIILHYR